MAELSVAALLGEWTERRPPEHTLALRFEACRVRLRSNSSALIARLASYFSPFLELPAAATASAATAAAPREVEIIAIDAPPFVPERPLEPYAPEPGKTRIKEEFAELPDGRLVRKRLTGMVFAFGGDRHLALGPCLENDNQIVNFVNSRFIQWLVRRGYLLCHAAGLSRGPRGIALAGVSGRGKSTLALHMLNHGLDFVSNDRLLIRPLEPVEASGAGSGLDDDAAARASADGCGAVRASGAARLEMVGVAKLPRVNPGTLLNNPALLGLLSPDEQRRYQSLPRSELRRLEAKHDVDIARAFGPGRFRLSAELAGIFILNWEWDSGPAGITPVVLAERPDLLAALMKRLGLFFEPPGGGLSPEPDPQEYLRTLGDCPVFELGGGVDFAAAVAAGRAQLEAG